VHLLTGKVGFGSRLDCHQMQQINWQDKWPPNAPNVNPLDYHVRGVMLEQHKTFYSKLKTIDGLKKVLQLIWDQLDVGQFPV